MALVREYRCIYDKACKDYKDITCKSNAWKEIAAKCALAGEQKDPKALQQRYSNIRTTFGRYLGKLKAPSGSGRDEISLKPQWEHLRWLITHIEHRNTGPNCNYKSLTTTSSIANEEEDCEVQQSDVDGGSCIRSTAATPEVNPKDASTSGMYDDDEDDDDNDNNNNNNK